MYVTQAQHDWIEHCTAVNEGDYVVQHHVKPWGVVIDIREHLPSGRVVSAAIIAIDAEANVINFPDLI